MTIDISKISDSGSNYRFSSSGPNSDLRRSFKQTQQHCPMSIVSQHYSALKVNQKIITTRHIHTKSALVQESDKLTKIFKKI